MSEKTYLDTIDRLEPEIFSIDVGAFNSSAAISLKRIADINELSLLRKFINDGSSNDPNFIKIIDRAKELMKILGYKS